VRHPVDCSGMRTISHSERHLAIWAPEEMICPSTAQAPVVDGVLGDPCSNAVTAVGGFTQPPKDDPPAIACRALNALARATTSG